MVTLKCDDLLMPTLKRTFPDFHAAIEDIASHFGIAVLEVIIYGGQKGKRNTGYLLCFVRPQIHMRLHTRREMLLTVLHEVSHLLSRRRFTYPSQRKYVEAQTEKDAIRWLNRYFGQWLEETTLSTTDG